MTTYVDPTLASFMRVNPLDKRKQIASKILDNYPDRVPIILGRGELRSTPEISRNKFLAPSDLMFTKFILEVRRHIPSLDSTTGLFFFLRNNTIVPFSLTMGEIYYRYKSSDGFLYITYTVENTFG